MYLRSGASLNACVRCTFLHNAAISVGAALYLTNTASMVARDCGFLHGELKFHPRYTPNMKVIIFT